MDGYGEYDADASYDLPATPPAGPLQGVAPIMPPQARALVRPMPPQTPVRPMPMPQDMARAYAAPSAQQGSADGAALAPPRQLLPPNLHIGPQAHVRGRHGLGAIEEPIPNGHLLGASVLLPIVGTVVGMKYAGGLWGGLGGAVAAGSLINVFRAVKFMVQGSAEADREAIISGTYAVVGIAGSAYLIYRGLKSQGARPNDGGFDDEDDDKLRGVK